MIHLAISQRRRGQCPYNVKLSASAMDSLDNYVPPIAYSRSSKQPLRKSGVFTKLVFLTTHRQGISGRVDQSALKISALPIAKIELLYVSTSIEMIPPLFEEVAIIIPDGCNTYIGDVFVFRRVRAAKIENRCTWGYINQK